jgi:hypothetical protein
MAAAALENLIRGDYRSQRTLPEGKEKDLLSWLDKIDIEGKVWRDAADMGRWAQNIDWYLGKRYLNTAPKFAANVIRPTLDRRNSLLTEQKPNGKFMPWRDGLQQAATILEQLFDAEWHATEMQMNIEEMLQIGAVLGSAGIDAAWNPGGHFGEGAFDPVVLDPRQVGFDPYVRRARLLDKAQYIWIETVKNVWELQRDYPGRGMMVTADKSVSSIATGNPNQSQSVLAQLSTSYQARQQRLEAGPVPRKVVREYWIRDPAMSGTGQPKFPLGRKVERAGELILDDGEQPYWDGQWPVVWYDGKPDIDSVWGRSEVEALRYIADAVNRIGNLFVENSILGGNLVVIADADAITNETRNKLTNAAGLIIPKKFGRTLEYRPPQPMPPHMLQFVTFALRFIDYLVGLNDGQLEGRGRIEMRSGVQLEGLQNAAQVLIKANARRLEAWLERFGQKWLSRVFQYYTGSRLLHYIGQNNEYQEWQFNYRELQGEFVKMLKADGKDTSNSEALKEMMKTAWRQFAFKIQPFSSLSSNKVARTQMLASLVEMGVLPRAKLLREVGYDNPNELMQDAQKEIAQFGPPQPPPKGKKK